MQSIMIQQDLASRALAIHEQLGKRFSVPLIHQNDRLGPLSQLVYALVAARTGDDLADSAFRKLSGAFWCWSEVRDAPIQRIRQLIADVPWADQKAECIQAALVAISDWSGWKRPSLEFLSEYSNTDALQWLRQLRGVGPKTAASVLLFSTLRRSVLPVDPHFARAATRIGLVSEGLTAEAIHSKLQAQLPSDWRPADLERHYLMMRGLGLRFCTIRYPKCGRCPARELCDFARSRQAMKGAGAPGQVGLVG